MGDRKCFNRGHPYFKVGYLTEGWKRFMENPLPVLGILILQTVVNAIPYVGGILAFFLTPLFIAMVLAILYRKTNNVGEAFQIAKERYLDFFLTSIFLSVLFILFLLFFAIVLVVPAVAINNFTFLAVGIIVAVLLTILIMVKFTPVYHYLINGLDVTDAFKRAWKVPYITSFKIAVLAFLIPVIVLLFLMVLLFLPTLSLTHLYGVTADPQLFNVSFLLLILDVIVLFIAAVLIQAWSWGIYVVASEDLLKEVS